MANLRSVRIPKDGVPVLKRIAALEDDRADRLIEALTTAEVLGVRALVATVAGVLGDRWSQGDVTSFVANLISMSTLGTSHNFALHEFSETITSLVIEELDDDERARLPGRLTALLDARGFRAFSKAIDVSREADRVLHVSRVLTDIRPVFSDEPQDDPLGAVVVHTLRLDFFHDGDVKTTSFSLNSNDLTQLKHAVERALSKEHTLSRLLERAELTEFDIFGESNA